MTNESKPVDVDREKVVPLKAGPPVKAAALSQMGATFAERKAAREAATKQVKADDGDVEDKAVKPSKRTSAKKG